MIPEHMFETNAQGQKVPNYLRMILMCESSSAYTGGL
jgi:hypothetical protein